MTNQLARKYTMPSLFMFALPNIIMMLFLSTYFIIDGIFISRIAGTSALSAVNIVYPAVSLQMALGIMLSTGGSAVIAKKLGEGDEFAARRDFTFLVTAEIFFGLLTAVLGILFVDEIVRFLGASEALFGMCRVYAVILFVFAPFFFLQIAFQTFFVTAGKPSLGLIFIVAAGLTHMILDYVFMILCGMGIAGAAWATGIGYCIPSVAGILFFLKPGKSPLYFVKPVCDWQVLRQTCTNGVSEMVTNLANAVTTFLFNFIFMRYWGEDGVASITIVLYFQYVFTAVYFGYSIGISPIISFKYGSGDKRQLKSLLHYSLLSMAACSVLAFIVSQLSASAVLSFFTQPDSRVYSITIQVFRYYAFGFLVMGISILASAIFTALSDGVTSAVISFARTFVFLVLVILFLPKIIGEIGVFLAVPAAEILGLIVSVIFFIRERKKLAVA